MATTKKARKRSYGSFDIEAINWNKFQIACVYNGDAPTFAKNPRELVALLDSCAKENMIWYAHVGGKYDFKFILRELLDKYHCRFRVINGSLAQITCYREKKIDGNGAYRYSRKAFELRDSFHLLPSSLEKLIASFDIAKAPTLSHVNWKWYSKCKSLRSKIFKLKKDELEKYVAVDCIALLEVIKKAVELFGKSLKITTAGQAFAEWEDIEETSIYKIPAVFDDFIRQAYSGGRTEVFWRKCGKAFYYDVVSMYPFAMQQFYPAGKVFRTDEEIKDKFAIYNCDVIAPKDLHIPFLHYRDPQTKKLLFPLGQWRGTYTSVEIANARRLGYSIKIIDGIAWTHKEKPFLKYVKKWFKVKDDAKKSGSIALQTIAKLYLNSLYGKTGQRREFVKIVTELSQADIDNGASVLDDDLGLYTITEKDNKPYTMTQLACFVTAYARIHLYKGVEQVHKKGGQVYYCDTDSLITSCQIESGKNLGDFECQHDNIIEGIFLVPKVYALKFSDGTYQIRAKGFNIKKLTYKHFERALTGKKFKTKRDGIIGFMEACRRGLDFIEVVDKSRELHTGLTKRHVEKDHSTKPLYVS